MKIAIIIPEDLIEIARKVASDFERTWLTQSPSIATIFVVQKGRVHKGISDNHNTTLNLSDVKPLIMEPITETIKDINDINEKNITQVYIGGCTNGRIDDMKDIADILKDNKINEDLTLIVCPASRNIANEMDERGYSKIIRDSGGIIINPGCGACSGIHQGVISKNDIIVTTTPRNTSGRMGDKDGKIYLSSPRSAAKIALKGKIN